MKRVIPQELLGQKRWFPVVVVPDKEKNKLHKHPIIKKWQEPEKQMTYSAADVYPKGDYVGFDTCGHGRAEDYLFLDFDHVLDANGEFVNDNARACFNLIMQQLQCFAERSVGGGGVHIFAVPTAGKFAPIAAGTKGTLYFDRDNDIKLEVFYKPQARYCLITGNQFKTDSTVIAHGEIVDEVFQHILAEIGKKQPVVKTARQELNFDLEPAAKPAKHFARPAVSVSADTPDDILDLAKEILDCLNPADLTADNDWLAVMSACKNIGVPYSVVDEFNQRDKARYDAKENRTRWDSLIDPSFNIETLAGLANCLQLATCPPELQNALSKWQSVKDNGKIPPPVVKELKEAFAAFNGDNVNPTDVDDPQFQRQLALLSYYATKLYRTALDKIYSQDTKPPMPRSELKTLIARTITSIKKAQALFAQALKYQQRQRRRGKREQQIQERLRRIDELKNAPQSAERDDEIISQLRGCCEWTFDRDHNPVAIKATSANLHLIFDNDPRLNGIIGYDEFVGADVFLKGAPWNPKAQRGDVLSDRDAARLRDYLSLNYSDLYNRDRVDDIIITYSDQNKFHVVKDFFRNLPSWDKQPRAETLFIKFLRADDTPYSREVTLNWLIAAVARIFHPGCDFQLCLVLKGKQGIGKSYIISRLGGAWYRVLNDNVDDPHAIDALQNSWLVEIPELKAMRKADVNSIKSFISTKEDNRRRAYDKRATVVPRHCVFIATVNDSEFLSDETGNRRFAVVECHSAAGEYVDELTDEFIAQLWAEVFSRYCQMFNGHFDADGDFIDDFDEKKLELTRATKKQVENVAQNFMRDDGLTGEIQAFLDTKIPPPVIWNLCTKDERRKFFVDLHLTFSSFDELINRQKTRGGRNAQVDLENLQDLRNTTIVSTNSIGVCIYGNTARTHICAAEIFNEAFGNDRRKSMRRISEVLAQLTDWHKGERLQLDPAYGDQKKVFYCDAENQPADTPTSDNTVSLSDSEPFAPDDLPL